MDDTFLCQLLDELHISEHLRLSLFKLTLLKQAPEQPGAASHGLLVVPVANTSFFTLSLSLYSILMSGHNNSYTVQLDINTLICNQLRNVCQ